MQQSTVTAKGWVLVGKDKIPIEARYASRFSIWVRFEADGKNNLKEGVEFSKLYLNIEDETFEMGNCMLVAEPNIDGYAGILIPTDDFHDFESLFFDRKAIKLQVAFLNLKLLLKHKNRINKAFKDYVADLAYDLSVYQNAFDTLDAEYQNEPKKIQDILQHAIIETEGQELLEYLDNRLDDLRDLVADFSKADRERHGYYFRRQLWNIILLVPFIKRTNLKPRGYAGDSEMMRMIYTKADLGETTFAKILQHHSMIRPAAEAVRFRRETIAKWIAKHKKKAGKDEKLQVLSVACGPGFELMDIFDSAKDTTKLQFTLFDQDQYALLEAAGLVDKLERSINAKISVDYLRESVRTMMRSKQVTSRWGQFNLIYSMGLFDYLTPPVAKAVTEKLYQLLIPGGEMMLGNFHVSNPDRYYMEYWLDWVIYHRSDEEFLELGEGLDASDTSLVSDPSGIQMFLKVKKG